MIFNHRSIFLSLSFSFFMSLRFSTFAIWNSTRRKCDRTTLRITKGDRRKGGRREKRRMRKAHGGMFRANRRDSAPTSIPRSSRQISTDEFQASRIPLRRVLSHGISRQAFFSVLFDQVDWQTRLFPERVCLAKINCYPLSFDIVSQCRYRYLETHKYYPISSFSFLCKHLPDTQTIKGLTSIYRGKVMKKNTM